MLEYELQRHTLTVRLKSELDHSAAAEIRGELDELLKNKAIRRLVLDLRKLKFMDSSGIGLIIGRYKLMARRGGSVAVVNADARMDKIFQMAGLYQLVDRMA
ncbi:MAG: anti-sigma factor antagonist [Clostridia bacterium]|nr:anti-sigma factor antagonist [Clostridia bacterium]